MLEFEEFCLDTKHLLLFKGGEQVDLPPKTVEILSVLVQNCGRVIKKDELMQIVWPDTIVEESNIFQNLYLLRKILGNGKNGRPFIQTLRRRGYRFSAKINRMSPEGGILMMQAGHASENKRVSIDSRFSNGALTGTAAILFCLLITSVASVFYRPWAGFSPDTPRRQFPKSIAVLPFRITNQGALSEPFGQGICDALITRLSNRQHTYVISSSTVRKYTNPEQDPAEIGGILGVDAVLDGGVQQDGGRVRVTVQLIDTLNRAAIWSSQVEAAPTNQLDMQDIISESLLTKMDQDLPQQN